MLRELAVCLGVGGGRCDILGKCWVQSREQGGIFGGGVWQELMWEGRGPLSCKRKWEGVGMASGPVGVGREVSKARVERLGFRWFFFFFQLKYIFYLQCCVNFCCTTKWFNYTHIHIYMYGPQRRHSGEESVYQCRRCKSLRIWFLDQEDPLE